MKELRINKTHLDEMIEHCNQGRPNEACGILATHDDEVVKVFRMTNAEASPVRYRFVDKEQMAVEDKIDAEGWTFSAAFHSHTRTEAYPSPTDVARALGDLVYVIVSLAEEPPVVRAFLIEKQNWSDQDGTVRELPVVVT
jgi:proteasome lid subunit RPN8/RPN11